MTRAAVYLAGHLAALSAFAAYALTLGAGNLARALIWCLLLAIWTATGWDTRPAWWLGKICRTVIALGAFAAAADDMHGTSGAEILQRCLVLLGLIALAMACTERRIAEANARHTNA